MNFSIRLNIRNRTSRSGFRLILSSLSRSSVRTSQTSGIFLDRHNFHVTSRNCVDFCTTDSIRFFSTCHWSISWYNSARRPIASSVRRSEVTPPLQPLPSAKTPSRSAAPQVRPLAEFVAKSGTVRREISVVAILRDKKSIDSSDIQSGCVASAWPRRLHEWGYESGRPRRHGTLVGEPP